MTCPKCGSETRTMYVVENFLYQDRIAASNIPRQICNQCNVVFSDEQTVIARKEAVQYKTRYLYSIRRRHSESGPWWNFIKDSWTQDKEDTDAIEMPDYKFFLWVARNLDHPEYPQWEIFRSGEIKI